MSSSGLSVHTGPNSWTSVALRPWSGQTPNRLGPKKLKRLTLVAKKIRFNMSDAVKSEKRIQEALDQFNTDFSASSERIQEMCRAAQEKFALQHIKNQRCTDKLVMLRQKRLTLVAKKIRFNMSDAVKSEKRIHEDLVDKFKTDFSASSEKIKEAAQEKFAPQHIKNQRCFGCDQRSHHSRSYGTSNSNGRLQVKAGGDLQRNGQSNGSRLKSYPLATLDTCPPPSPTVTSKSQGQSLVPERNKGNVTSQVQNEDIVERAKCLKNSALSSERCKYPLFIFHQACEYLACRACHKKFRVGAERKFVDHVFKKHKTVLGSSYPKAEAQINDEGELEDTSKDKDKAVWYKCNKCEQMMETPEQHSKICKTSAPYDQIQVLLQTSPSMRPQALALRCGICNDNVAFISKGYLRQHLNKVHPVVAPKVLLSPCFWCAKCHKRFPDTASLTRHCVTCNVLCPDKNGILDVAKLTAHCGDCDVMHDTIEEVDECNKKLGFTKCLLCLRTLEITQSLSGHLKTYHGKTSKGTSCKYCPKAINAYIKNLEQGFTDKELVKHVQTVHLNPAIAEEKRKGNIVTESPKDSEKRKREDTDEEEEDDNDLNVIRVAKPSKQQQIDVVEIEDLDYEDENFTNDENSPGSPIGIQIVNTVSLSQEVNGNPQQYQSPQKESDDSDEYDEFETEDDSDMSMSGPVISSVRGGNLAYENDNMSMITITSVSGGDGDGQRINSMENGDGSVPEIIPVDINSILGL